MGVCTGAPPATTHLGDITREHEAVDAQLADAAADELRVLRPIVQDQHQAVRRAPCARHPRLPTVCLSSHAVNEGLERRPLLAVRTTVACVSPVRGTGTCSGRPAQLPPQVGRAWLSRVGGAAAGRERNAECSSRKLLCRPRSGLERRYRLARRRRLPSWEQPRWWPATPWAQAS